MLIAVVEAIKALELTWNWGWCNFGSWLVLEWGWKGSDPMGQMGRHCYSFYSRAEIPSHSKFPDQESENLVQMGDGRTAGLGNPSMDELRHKSRFCGQGFSWNKVSDWAFSSLVFPLVNLHCGLYFSWARRVWWHFPPGWQSWVEFQQRLSAWRAQQV